jgi:hypothetical protein
MAYSLSPSELLIEKFSFEWIQPMKTQLSLMPPKLTPPNSLPTNGIYPLELLANEQIKLLDELQNMVTCQHKLHAQARSGNWATGRDESDRHRKDSMGWYFIPCFNFMLHTILYIHNSLKFIPVYYTDINQVKETSLHCEYLVIIYPVIKKLLHLDYSEDISINDKKIKISQQNIANYLGELEEGKIEEIIKYIHLINFKWIYSNRKYNLCNKFRHQLTSGRCECYYHYFEHRKNTIVCDKIFRKCVSCIRKYTSSNKIDSDYLTHTSLCEDCGIDGKLHKIDYYCVCDIKKMDAQTLKLHYIKCMDPTLTIDSMPSKYFTKYAITEALNNNVKIVVPIHEIKQSKPKKSISASLRQKVWNQYIGLSVGETLCKCCNTNIISQLRFHCGHVIAEACGGETTLENLRPICEKCNLSMGTQNLNDFAQTLL